MSISSRRFRRIFLTTLVCGSISSSAPAAGVSAGPRLAADSPLAVDGGVLFAVGADEQTLLSRRLSPAGAWTPFSLNRTFGRVSGLTAAGGKLYVSDSAEGAVHRIDIASRSVEELHRGAPLISPADLAVAGDVFVADTASGTVYRLKAGSPPEALTMEGEPLPPGPLFLASSMSDLVISAPASARVFEFRRVEQPSKISWSVRQSKADGPRPAERAKDVLRAIPFPAIKQPGPVGLFRGILYVIDRADNQLYAVERNNPRPVRLVRSDRNGISLVRPSSLLVTERSLYVLDGKSGNVQVWPRLIPALIELQLSSLSETMASVYDYLYNRNILPTRIVPLKENIETTLRAERVLLAPYVSQLDRLLCNLNPQICKEGQMRPLQEGEMLRVPDLRSENVVDSEKVVLDGKATLGEEADQRIQSKEFALYKTEKKLQDLNTQVSAGLPEGASVSLRDHSQGEMYVWVEYVRYLSPIVASDAPPAPSPLTTLTKKYRRLRIRPLTERPPTASSTPPDPPDAPAWRDLKQAFDQILKVISYVETVPLQPVYVGIAEDPIDRDNPDLADAFLPPDEDEVLAHPASGAAGPTVPRIRAYEKADHGTMVSALIGARKTEYETKGLAPRALLFSLHTSDAQLGDDIRKAFNRGVRIFNISAHFDRRIPTFLNDRINLHQNALFVVAAGNDTITGTEGAVCASVTYFPVCWADRDNVLVVTGTTAGGGDLLPPVRVDDRTTLGGANWSSTHVHVAAPGEGFYASGPDRSYVPARGSSFSTPMVTATAALLYAQRIVQPASIKHRIIATADPMPNLRGKVLGGLLNVRRALSNPSAAVLRNAAGQELVVEIVPGSRIAVRPPDGDDRTLSLSKVLRLHRYGSGYRVVYLDENKLRVLEGATFPQEKSSKFKYRDASGAQFEGDLVEWIDYVGPVVS